MELKYKSADSHLRHLPSTSCLSSPPPSTTTSSYTSFVDCFTRLIYHFTESHSDIEITKALMSLPNLISASARTDPIYLPDTYLLFLLDMYRSTQNERFRCFILIALHRIIEYDSCALTALLDSGLLTALLDTAPSLELSAAKTALMNLITLLLTGDEAERCRSALSAPFLAALAPRMALPEHAAAWADSARALLEADTQCGDAQLIIAHLTETVARFGDDTYVAAKVCWAAAAAAARWADALADAGFAGALAQLYGSGDHRLAEASAAAVGELALAGVCAAGFDCALVAGVCREFCTPRVVRASFWALAAVLELRPELAGGIGDALEIARGYGSAPFELKREIARAAALILRHAQAADARAVIASGAIGAVAEALTYANGAEADAAVEGLRRAAEIAARDGLTEELIEARAEAPPVDAEDLRRRAGRAEAVDEMAEEFPFLL